MRPTTHRYRARSPPAIRIQWRRRPAVGSPNCHGADAPPCRTAEARREVQGTTASAPPNTPSSGVPPPQRPRKPWSRLAGGTIQQARTHALVVPASAGLPSPVEPGQPADRYIARPRQPGRTIADPRPIGLDPQQSAVLATPPSCNKRKVPSLDKFFLPVNKL